MASDLENQCLEEEIDVFHTRVSKNLIITNIHGFISCQHISCITQFLLFFGLSHRLNSLASIRPVLCSCCLPSSIIVSSSVLDCLITFNTHCRSVLTFLYVFTNGGVSADRELLDVSSPKNSARPSSILQFIIYPERIPIKFSILSNQDPNSRIVQISLCYQVFPSF